MRVQELIDILHGYAPDHEIYLSVDEEGNRFHLLRDVEHNAVYDGDGGIGLHHLTDELMASGFTDEDVREGDPVIVLWP